MSLQINGSNSLEQLADQLSKDLQKQKNDVFQSQFIVTQTLGMNNWLKIKIAEKVGIVANCRFLKPNDLIKEISFTLIPKTRQALSADSLPWVLFALLAAKDFRDRFRKIAAYYTDDDVKRLALAEKVADLFDQYQIYRPEMISEWNRNEPNFEGSNGWQKYLWIKAKEALGDDMPDKTVTGKQIIVALQEADQQRKLASKIPAIHVFGLSIITAYHIRIFHELGKFINVIFYLLNPAPAMYWFEDKSEKQLALWKRRSKVKLPDSDWQSSGNPLLTGWGRILQDTFSMFFENEALLNEYDYLQAEEPAATTLLKKIQNEIFNNTEAENRNAIEEDDIDDGSITVNACYTIAREVEVLYNYLVHLVDRKKEVLSAREVVVMVSDIDAYAPYIKAIFSAGRYQFPFTIADESFRISDNLFSALQSVLALSEENFKAEDVMQLLDSSYIRKRFAITNTELVRMAADKANIRFGIEGSQDNETIYVGWKNGIKRIMYGICMSHGEEYLVDGYPVYPLDIAEGEDSFELIRFCHFAEMLISTIEDRKRARTVTEWGEYIEQVTDKMICQAEDSNDEDYQLLLQNLEKLYLLKEVVNDKINFDVFNHSFFSSLSTESRSGSFAAGGITFCSLIPMRSIPFKVVALLGLNFDKFPRKETRVSFNLMEQEKRKGDRNVKENDKHLFLETLLSAQKYFYLSYIGRSAKDNALLPPSVLVDELLDYIQAGTLDVKMNVRQRLATTQPLHSFSRKYLQDDDKFYSYSTISAAVSNPATAGANNNTAEELTFGEISIDSFVNFFKNPFKAYYNTVLSIRYEQDNVLLPENEIFELDGLQAWQLKQHLLFTDAAEMAGYRNEGVAKGNLPLRNMADFTIVNTGSEVARVKQLVDEIIGDQKEESLHVELLIDNTWLKGKLSRIYEGKLLFISFSKNEGKYLLEAYIRFLIATAAGSPVDLYYLSGERKRVYQVDENSRSQKSALKTLQKLLRLYKAGHEEIFLFYPDFNKSPADIAHLTADKFRSLINKHLESDYCDTYFKKEHSFGLFEQDGIFQQFVSNSENILTEAKDLLDKYYLQ